MPRNKASKRIRQRETNASVIITKEVRALRREKTKKVVKEIYDFKQKQRELSHAKFYSVIEKTLTNIWCFALG